LEAPEQAPESNLESEGAVTRNGDIIFLIEVGAFKSGEVLDYLLLRGR